MSSSAEWLREIAAIDFHWREVLAGVIVRAVRPTFVVEAEEGREVRRGLGQVSVAAQVDLVVLDRAPEPFDENIIETPALAVHRELHAAGEQWLGEFCRGELATLVSVENFRRAVFSQRSLHRPDTEAGVEGVRQFLLPI